MVAFAAIFFADATLAQQYPYEKILVPILINGTIPGAHGSVWTTSLVARIESDSSVEITPIVGGLCGLCPVNGPHTTISLTANNPNPNGGAFFYVGPPGIGLVNF